MDRRKLLAAALVTLPVIAGGIVLASQQGKQAKQAQQATAQGYICPATGEELPCPNCCPLNGN